MAKHTIDPAVQIIKGIFIVKKQDTDDMSETCELLKSVSCEVLSVNKDRITIIAARGKLQEIKKCWLANNSNKLSVSLNEQFSKIMLGGNYRHSY